MPRNITIVDTGSGNLRSVEKALVAVGGRPSLSSRPEEIAKADAVVVPGQGAFGQFAQAIDERGLRDALRQALASGRPFLGICLGLQVLFDESEEQGPIAGLGFVPGRVRRFRPEQAEHKVPHMGWNRVFRSGASGDPLLSGIEDGAYVYFVHSYFVEPTDAAVISLECDYEQRFCAAIRQDNLFACQFHPEKSQRVGLQLLANFVESS